MISKTDKIVITGATGFVGSYILKYFWSQGYSNIHASRRSSSSMDMLGEIADKIQWYEADLVDVPQLELLIDQATLVIHTAAMVTYQKKHRDQLFKTNVEGTANIVNVCLAKNVQKLLYVSSIAALGKDEFTKIISENQEWENSDIHSDYAVSKYQAELEVWRGQEEGLDVAMVNPGVVLGAGKWSDSSLAILKTVANGVKFYPIGSNGFVDVRDVAQMVYALLDKNISGERITAVAESIKIKDLIWTIADKISAPRASIEVKKWMIPILWRAAYIWGIITNKDAFINKPTLESTSRDWTYNNQKSKDLLGIQYRSLEQSIGDMCDAYNLSVKQGKDYAVFRSL
jgi:dihydroflavonol-4-reductase